MCSELPPPSLPHPHTPLHPALVLANLVFYTGLDSFLERQFPHSMQPLKSLLIFVSLFVSLSLPFFVSPQSQDHSVSATDRSVVFKLPNQPGLHLLLLDLCVVWRLLSCSKCVSLPCNSPCTCSSASPCLATPQRVQSEAFRWCS